MKVHVTIELDARAAVALNRWIGKKGAGSPRTLKRLLTSLLEADIESIVSEGEAPRLEAAQK